MTRAPVPVLSWSEEAVPFQGQRKKCRPLGITLIELVFIVLIVLTLGGIAIPAYNKYRDNTNMVQAVVDIRTMEHDIYIHEAYAGTFPDSLDEVGKGNLRDPWRNPYQYINALTKKGQSIQRFDKLFKPLNSDFDLYSMGKDGKTEANLDKKVSLDDIVRALNGQFVGLASEY